MQAALRLMHEERLERFEDFRDGNDQSSAGDDASSSAKETFSPANDASSSANDASSPANDAPLSANEASPSVNETLPSVNGTTSSTDASSSAKEASPEENAEPLAPEDASTEDGEAEWIAEAREEALRRKGDHPSGPKKKGAAGTLTGRTLGESLAAAGPAAFGPAMGDHSDEALFLRYQQGDDGAFFTIYERYKTSIYAYCAQVLFSVGLSREIVEDTFQDVFLRLVQYRDTFTGGDFRPWIFTVTRHSCLSVKRRAFRQRATIENIGDGVNFEDGVSSEVREAFSESDDPLERMSLEEQTGLLLAAIARLPEEYREALLLSEYEGMTYGEIGRMLGTSLSTIRIRIFRAKARLRKMLLPILGDADQQIVSKK